ncbi:MAG: hypothetical protein KC417_16475 [Myxococcales bacterium]|nr:hypothetical protein [Myxococcales bacterium]
MRSLRWIGIVVSLSTVALTGCVDDDGAALFVEGQVGLKDGCFIDSTVILTTGSLTVGTTPAIDYQLRTLMASTLRDTTRELAADPNMMMPTYYEVEIREFQGGLISFEGLPNPFSTPASGALLDSRTGSTPGSQTWTGTGIPEAYAEQLADLEAAGVDTVVMHVFVHGTTLGDIDVKSNEWVWPVHLGAVLATVCEDDSNAYDVCAPGQDSGRLILDSESPLCGG